MVYHANPRRTRSNPKPVCVFECNFKHIIIIIIITVSLLCRVYTIIYLQQTMVYTYSMVLSPS